MSTSPEIPRSREIFRFRSRAVPSKISLCAVWCTPSERGGVCPSGCCPNPTRDCLLYLFIPRVELAATSTRRSPANAPGRCLTEICFFSATLATVRSCASYGGLMPSEVVHLATPDPAEQAPLVARSVTPPSPTAGRERGDDTASAACTSILYRVCYDPPK